MKAYDSGVAGRNVKTFCWARSAAKRFPPVTRNAAQAVPSRLELRVPGALGLMLHFSAVRGDFRYRRRPRRPRGFGNQVTLDLTLHCYNLARFFGPDLRLAS